MIELELLARRSPKLFKMKWNFYRLEVAFRSYDACIRSAREMSEEN
jgi:hypothetical protein